MRNQNLPIAIIGAGPVGMAAAAHLKKAKKPFILFESGPQVGHSIAKWGHVRLFSPWRYNIDKVAEELLKAAGIPIPDKNQIPYGNEIVSDYLMPLAGLDGIKENIHLNTKVIAIGKKGLDKTKNCCREEFPFAIHAIEKGKLIIYEAKNVIDASGTWQNSNPIGSGGVYAVGEKENREDIYYGMPDIATVDKETYANKTTLVVGSGHSAIGTILALNTLVVKYPKTKIHWILRKENISAIYGGQEADQLEARGTLGIQIESLVTSGTIKIHTPVYIHEIETSHGQKVIKGVKNNKDFKLSNIDQIIGCTGARPDFDFLRELRFERDAALECVPLLAELIDPNIHSCGTVRPHGEAELRQIEKGFYIVGMKSYGRAPTFLMTTGYEQIRSIVAYISGDFQSAKKVELLLPETGVCSSGIGATLLDKAKPKKEKVRCC